MHRVQIDAVDLSFENSVKKITADEAYINEVIDFKWDNLYVFSPYLGRDYIAEKLNLHKWQIPLLCDSMYEDTYTYVITKGKTVVACNNFKLYGDFYIEGSSSYAENAVYEAARIENGISLIKKN